MWEWLNTGFGAISVVGVWVTFIAWWNSRETNKILARQGDILQGMDTSTKTLLAQMEANAVTRHVAVIDKLEGRA